MTRGIADSSGTRSTVQMGQDFVEGRVRVEARVDGRKALGRVPTGTGGLATNAGQEIVFVRVAGRRGSIDHPDQRTAREAQRSIAWRSRSESECGIAFLFFGLGLQSPVGLDLNLTDLTGARLAGRPASKLTELEPPQFVKEASPKHVFLTQLRGIRISPAAQSDWQVVQSSSDDWDVW